MDELVNRLAARLWQLASAKTAARVELEVARLQTELLEQAAVFRRGHGKIGEQVARRLEATCERLLRESQGESANAEWTCDLDVGLTIHGLADRQRPMPVNDADGSGKRSRGRPKKASAGEAPLKQSADDEPFAAIEEVTDEERTGTRDPARTDQVPDLPAQDDCR